MRLPPIIVSRFIVILFAGCAVAGCGYLGPNSVNVTRPEYNAVIQETNSRELLLNLVRLRYRDPTYFLHVERVVSALEVERTLTGSVSAVENANDTIGVGGAVRFMENPTVFYVPMAGEHVVRDLMSPPRLETLLLFAYSGWSMERLLAMTVQEANGLKNAPSASGPTPVREPVYREFRDALRHLRALQVRQDVELGRKEVGEEIHIELRLGKDAEDADAAAFKRLMGLDPSLNEFRIIAGLGRGDGRSIVLATRPLIAVMNYLSQGVEVPRSDLDAGRVTRTIANDGAEFDWQEMLGGMFRVQSGDKRPVNAAVAVRYRGSWFYIDDSDLESKSTFTLLNQLLALQASKDAAAGPGLTFSIGR